MLLRMYACINWKLVSIGETVCSDEMNMLSGSSQVIRFYDQCYVSLFLGYQVVLRLSGYVSLFSVLCQFVLRLSGCMLRLS
jgi:hypothetical protein